MTEMKKKVLIRHDDVEAQLNILEESKKNIPAFEKKMEEIGMWPFKAWELSIFQVNVGYLCNQTCRHCHVAASPLRKEIMTKETMQLCLKCIG